MAETVVSGCVGVMGSGIRMALGIPVELQSSCSICVFCRGASIELACLSCHVLDLEVEITNVFFLCRVGG